MQQGTPISIPLSLSLREEAHAGKASLWAACSQKAGAREHLDDPRTARGGRRWPALAAAAAAGTGAVTAVAAL